jgi:hypothetical protein
MSQPNTFLAGGLDRAGSAAAARAAQHAGGGRGRGRLRCTHTGGRPWANPAQISLNRDGVHMLAASPGGRDEGSRRQARLRAAVWGQYRHHDGRQARAPPTASRCLVHLAATIGVSCISPL